MKETSFFIKRVNKIEVFAEVNGEHSDVEICNEGSSDIDKLTED